MTEEPSGRPDWRSWDAQSWNRALFQYFFVATAGDSRVVSRLAVTAEELAKATVMTGAEPQAALKAFSQAIRCTPSEFRRHVSGANLVKREWRGEELPPFLAYLLFTCFAAASLDAHTINQGVFRERLRVLLGHSVGTSYALSGLPLLWKAFDHWLENRRAEGAPYRALVLPDPGRMTLIGYSVRLAFPPRYDRLHLVKLIREADLRVAPTVPEAIRLVSRRIENFSNGFREVFARARRAFSGGVDAPELEAFWSAIVEAARLAATQATDRSARLRYQLLLQEDDLLRLDPVLVASSRAPSAHGTVNFTRIEEPLDDDYRFLVCASADGSTTVVTAFLLLGVLADRLPDLKQGLISRAVEQGLLLFRRNDNGTWELATSRPEEGPVRALVTNALAQPFASLFKVAKPRVGASKFDGWSEIGQFDVAFLGEVTAERAPALAGVRCLQRTKVGAHIALADGVRTVGGYLGTRGLLPGVRCAGAREVTLFEVDRSFEGVRTQLIGPLVSRSGDPDLFEFPLEHGDLEGVFSLVATHGRQVVDSREVVFYSRILGHSYAAPTEPHRWIIEAAGPDVLPADVGADCFLRSLPIAAEQNRRPSHSPASRRDPGSQDDPIVEAVTVDDDARLDRFVEALAAVSASRKGLGESEFLDLLMKVVALDEGPGIWDVVRAWLEAGYLDVLSRRHWRGRVYFARRPRLVVARRDFGPTVVLYGLAPYRLRIRARTVLRDLGAVSLGGYSVSRFVGAPQAWALESIAVADSAAQELALGPVEYVDAPSRPRTPIEGAADGVTDRLPGYECQGVWDWERGGFRRGRSDSATEQVRIEWHTRADRPDLHVVVRRDGECWATFSRNWALLRGYVWAERLAFERRANMTLIRTSSFGPYIPLPVARVVALHAGVTAGPIDQSGRGGAYAYRLSSGTERRWLLHWLCGQQDDTQARRRLAWLLSASSDPLLAGDAVSLPADLRRRLRALAAIPEAARFSGRRVPRRMLPHLRRAIELAGA